MCWLVECAFFLGLPRLLARLQAQDPFCETSNDWAEKIEVAHKFAFIDEPHAVRALLERQTGELPSVLLPWLEDASPDHARLTIHRCRGEDSYLSIDNVAVKVGKDKVGKDKVEKSTTPVLHHLRLPGIDPDELVRELTTSAAKPSQEEQQLPPVPAELEGAVDHLNAGRLEQAFDAARPHACSEQADLRIDANRLCGIASSHLGRWDTALGFWQTLFADEPSAHNAMQLATSSVMAGDLAGGASWLERARTMNATRNEMPRITLETNYISALTQSGNEQAALPSLEEIRQCYLYLGVTDPTFLFVRQFPRFDVFLEKSADIVRASLQGEQARSWYTSMLPHLDERGKVELMEWVDTKLQLN